MAIGTFTAELNGFKANRAISALKLLMSLVFRRKKAPSAIYIVAEQMFAKNGAGRHSA